MTVASCMQDSREWSTFVFLEHRSSMTVPIILSSCSLYRPCLFIGFFWYSLTFHPDPKEKAAFHTQPAQHNPTKHIPTQHNPKPITNDCNKLTARTVPAQLLVVASGTQCWQQSVRSAWGGGAGNASPNPFSASAHKAAGVGCLLFSLQPGM